MRPLYQAGFALAPANPVKAFESEGLVERSIETRRPAYNLKMLARDTTAGLTVAAVDIPQAMAYALIAGIKPEYGLYTAIVTPILASLLGSSSHLIAGPTNALSLAVFSAVAGLPEGMRDQLSTIDIVCLLTILVGFIQLLIALLKLGDLTRYVSESVILGFMSGAALLIALGQVHNFFGLNPQGHGGQHFLYRLWLTVTQGGPINPYALVMGAATVAIVMPLRRLDKVLGFRFPDKLAGLLLASVVVWGFDLAGGPDHPGVEVIGPVPSRLPPFHVPPLERGDFLRELSLPASAIALLGLVESLAIAKAVALRTRQRLDFNRQCLAEGLANMGGGLFRCMPGCGSLTRSAINYQAGAVTRVAGLMSAAGVAVVVLLFADKARYVPKPALAGILLVTVWRLVDRQRLWYCLRATRFDAGLALATAGAAIFISIEFSILIGTFLSFLFYVPRAARLQCSELVVTADRVVRERQPDDLRCRKMALFSLEGEFFFGAAPELDEYLEQVARQVDDGARVVVLRFKRVRNPDMVCLERLQHFIEDMEHQGVPVLLCGVRKDLARALDNLDFHRWLPKGRLFLEEHAPLSSTLRAVRDAYELLGQDLCATCPRRGQTDAGAGEWTYVI
jgi:SulP family sulfate permease